ncbi:MAG: thiol:disulfide interchange protein DsbA/DsbL [Thiobacillus sp.]|nr:thiol:disulfide interchange protein DsbA/DsbL [Thiobacillus sp.]
MRLVHVVATLVLSLPAAWFAPAASAAEAGKDYTVLSPAQPTAGKGKVEVVEFFAYTCPHCFDLEPELEAWARKLPRNVVLKRQPVIFSDDWEPMARAYFALEALGVADKLHADVFNAVHIQDKNLSHPEDFFDWGAKQGLDRAKLKAAFESFSTGTKVARAKQLQRAYKINGVPTLAVNGKYVTSASMTGSNANTLKVASELIRMEGGK